MLYARSFRSSVAMQIVIAFSSDSKSTLIESGLKSRIVSLPPSYSEKSSWWFLTIVSRISFFKASLFIEGVSVLRN